MFLTSWIKRLRGREIRIGDKVEFRISGTTDMRLGRIIDAYEVKQDGGRFISFSPNRRVPPERVEIEILDGTFSYKYRASELYAIKIIERVKWKNRVRGTVLERLQCR